MITIKSSRERAIMKTGGAKLTEVLDMLLDEIRPGITPLELDEKADTMIRKLGGVPSFQKVEGYRWATCININDVVVHGIPTKTIITSGDVVGIDVGMFYKGFHTDTSWTVCVPPSTATPRITTFLQAGQDSPARGIAHVVSRNKIGDISQAMQAPIEASGFHVVEELVGHGIGRTLHEDPEIPGMLVKPVSKTPVIKPGMAFALEIIYTMGKPDITIDDDDWTIRTGDGTISGLFEKTVIVEDHGVVVLT